MSHPLQKFKQKVDQLHSYMFPDEHSISVHHSTINTNTLFYTRIFSLIYLTIIYIWSIAITQTALTNIIYLTMEGYYVTWIFFLLTIQDYMINGLGRWGRVFPICNNLKYYIEILYELAFCIQLPITLVFWGFLFKLILDMQGVTTEIIIVNANLHAAPLVFLCIDMAYNTFRFPRRHFHIILIFGLIYAIINASYSLAAHIIYKPIDWVSVLSYILMASSVLMSFIMHWLGNYIFDKCKKHKIQSQMMEGLIDANKKIEASHSEGDTQKDKKNKEQTVDYNIYGKQDFNKNKVSMINEQL